MKNILIIILTILLCTMHANAAQHNVLTYGAIRNDGGDDAPAFRAAVAAAIADKGGIVYIPAGDYIFSSADPLDSSTCLLVYGTGVHIEGDSRTIAGGAGVTIYGANGAVGKSLVKFASYSISYGSTHGAIIENVALTRYYLTSYEGKTTPGSIGIALGYAGSLCPPPCTYGGNAHNIIIRNVSCWNNYAGLSSDTSDLDYSVNFERVTVEDCDFSANYKYGIFIRDFEQMRFSRCRIYANGEGGGEGVRIAPQNYRSNDLTFRDCSIVENYGIGISINGQSTPAQLPTFNVGIDSCNIMKNGLQGCVILQSDSVRITNSTVQFNAQSGAGPAGLYLYQSRNVLIASTRFVKNKSSGLIVSDSSGVSVNGATFDDNNTAGTGTVYALVVSQGASHVYTGLSFTRTIYQTNGILLQFDPTSLVGSACTFPTGMTNYVAQFGNTAAAEFSFDYFNGTSPVNVQD